MSQGKTSINGHLILTPYTKTKELRTTEAARGFAVTENKVAVDYLELLVDALVNLGQNSQVNLPKGTKIYFKEEVLHTQKWPREVYQKGSEDFPEGFVLGYVPDIVFYE
jgi:hypothetical protein